MLKVRRSALYTLWFRYYSRAQLRKYFDKVRTKGTEALQTMNLSIPIIFYCNHAYWWDGFWTQLCTEAYFKQNLYIIIEHKQLVRYQFFTRLGAFSIVRENPRQAIESINYAVEKLLEPSPKQNALWIFPQGIIEHVDKRPLRFFTGTAKIVEKIVTQSRSVYLASVVSRIEYLEEQKPELFLSFQPPDLISRENFPSVKMLTLKMQEKTEQHLDWLREQVLNRQFEGFHTLLEGKLSINRRWDRFREQLGLQRTLSD
ncbi:MAG: lysophospholipid acyltransferase family protein [Chloroherpetonaceae bacterium]|nr:lysophospholipid acyltransferase family protein [Chloroherpetonaceae bacterium]